MSNLIYCAAFALTTFMLIIDGVKATPHGLDLNSVLHQELLNDDNAKTKEEFAEPEPPRNSRLKRSTDVDYSGLTTFKTSLNSSEVRAEDFLPAGALYGEWCPLFRFIFFAVPLYFCPVLTDSPVIVSTEVGSEIGNKINLDADDDLKLNRPTYFPNSPINLIPAVPKHPLSRPPPPVDHGTEISSVSSPSEDKSIEYSPAVQSNSGRMCALAISNCCKPGSPAYDELCFERNGCSGPFFGSPCSI